MSFTSSQHDKYFIRVSEDLPTLDDCYKFVSDPSCGAVATFTGTTRDNFKGKKVTRLSYEGYVPMAEKELRKTCDDARTKFHTFLCLEASSSDRINLEKQVKNL